MDRPCKDILRMNLESLLLREENAIAHAWFHAVVAAYPPETGKAPANEENRFANPVGHIVHESVTGICAEMLRGGDPAVLAPLLDEVIRIRAVQNFSPSEAVAFVFLLKGIVREALRDPIRAGLVSHEELADFDARTDRLALLAFDVYSQCREKLYAVRMNEVKNRTYRLLQRTGFIAPPPGPGNEAEK